MTCLPRMTLALAIAGGAPAQVPDAEKANLLLLQAERAAFEGNYSKARSLYRHIADKYPKTRAGAKAIARSRPSAFLGWSEILRHGPSENRVDVVVAGDGYTMKHLRALENITRVVPKLFERNKTLGEYFRYHNFLRANVVSKDDGIDAHGRRFDTALGGRQSGAIQGQCTCDRGLVRRMLAEIPQSDGLAVVYVKQGVLGTGGGGVATVGGRGDKTTIHEWGHAFAGLSDEYAQTTGHRGEVGIGINVTGDPENVPWAHWISRKAPGIGVYQGANGQERGAWKPVASGCVMEHGDKFCRVCREAIVLRIHQFVDPIESVEPPAHFAEIRDPQAESARPLVLNRMLTFAARVMRPKSHAIQVRWWIIPEARMEKTPRRRGKDRRTRGPLPFLEDQPKERSYGKAGLHRFKILTKSLAPGRYKVVCRAIDTTRLSRDRLPWVLKDDRGVLQSERAWLVDVPPR